MSAPATDDDLGMTISSENVKKGVAEKHNGRPGGTKGTGGQHSENGARSDDDDGSLSSSEGSESSDAGQDVSDRVHFFFFLKGLVVFR